MVQVLKRLTWIIVHVQDNHDLQLMINRSQIGSVRELWREVEPKAAAFTDALYEELFTAEPHLRILFEGPMDEQHLKLASFVDHVIGLLDKPDEFTSELRELGDRHLKYGVRPYHFDALGLAWTAAMKRVMVREIEEEEKEAWGAFYACMAAIMQEGIEAHALERG